MSVHTHIQSKAMSSVSRNQAVDRHLLESQHEFLAYLRRRLGSLDEAEDALQSFSLKVVRAAQVPIREEKINAWMGQILRNTLIDHYRRRATRHRAEAAYAHEASFAEATPEADDRTGPCRCLHAALQRMHCDHADVLRRADLLEEPRARIAADLGLTTNALNVRLHRARQALRQELEASCSASRVGKFLDCACG